MFPETTVQTISDLLYKYSKLFFKLYVIFKREVFNNQLKN